MSHNYPFLGANIRFFKHNDKQNNPNCKDDLRNDAVLFVLTAQNNQKRAHHVCKSRHVPSSARRKKNTTKEYALATPNLGVARAYN